MIGIVSIVIPVYNGEAELSQCLAGIGRATLQPLEVIVVDDGSTDGSRAVAEEFGAKVLETGGRCGPAKARNLGARAASGEILFFLDADVVPREDAVSRVASAFQNDPALDALIGSYDEDPAERDFLSQYRNLMHCYVHQTAQDTACTFWSGCGAIRKELFLAHSGFDESYARPAIEDIELGYRLHNSNRRMRLDKHLRVKHLKRWTFWNLVKTDVMDRGIPWTELILRDNNMPDDLNLQLSQRVSVALAFVSVGFALVLTVYWGGYFLTPIFALLLFMMSRFWLEGHEVPGKRAVLGITIGFALLVGMAWQSQMLEIIPPVLLGYILLFLRHRYAHVHDRRAQLASWALMVYGVLSSVFLLTYLPGHIMLGLFFTTLLAMVVLNNQFYLFLAAKRGRAFAISAIPFHLLYHSYNGISFGVGFLRHHWNNLFRHAPPALEK